ncbi:MAG: DUF4292 domain-containing protein [Muribaculaceae bacterium]|nr:DUF4292 domain-containing protein [Muribaculaceae bacterium]
MFRRIAKIILIFFTFHCLAWANANGEDTITDTLVLELDSIEYELITDSITSTFDETVEPAAKEEDFILLEYPDYEPWEKATLNGKLKMQGLPLSPSIKIFMEKDSLIEITVRAPFIGEAGRLVISKENITAVNKLNKTYVSENVTEILKYYPGGIGDIQDLLLGRFFIPGFDLAETEPDSLIDIYFEDEQFNVVPKGEAQIDGIKYGFVVDDGFNPLAFMVMPDGRPDIQFAVLYTYKLQDYDVRFMFQEGVRVHEATLELKGPEWKGDASKAIDLRNYRKVSFNDFLSNF